MSQKVFKIVREMNLKDINTQLALQCAPLITGLKASNLLIVQNENVNKVKQILKNTDIFYYVLLAAEKKTTMLLYKPHQLDLFISDKRIRNMLITKGYQEFTLASLLQLFQVRYEDYRTGGKYFPHEMGLFLGYPIEDVEGFIKNKGKNFLYTGYWKVYENLSEKLKLFQKFELAKETLIQLVSYGMSIAEVINIFNNNGLQQVAV
nr:DUF3793 family protein [Sedimentibacter sp.]